MWVLDHMEDLESDFSAIHRIDDITSLDGPRFLRMALRIFAYDGVMAARLREEAEDPRNPQRTTQAPQQAERRVSLSEMQIAHAGIIERSVSSG